ncbi:MAG: alpha/beta hydrolase-fold protein [Telluria sp.]
MRLMPIAALMLAASASATTVRIHYDAGHRAMLVMSDKGPMSWTRGAPAVATAGHVWTYTWPDILGDIVMKPALGKDKMSTGGAYRIMAGATQDIYPFFGPATGQVTIGAALESPQLKNRRKLRIYLPPSYAENAAKRYPVLYMHDGQNLFDAKTAAYGVEWEIDETANRLIAAGVMDEIIVVGIDNTPERIAEYTPCCDPKHGGGRLDAYQAFVTATVKPYIDRTLRTLPGRETSAIMGSSLGGIASVSIAHTWPQVFSKAGGLSSSFWWNERSMVTQPFAHVPVRFYLDAGTNDDGLDATVAMRDALVKQGYKVDADLMFHADEGGSHNEKSWAARVNRPLTWFFPWGSTKQ